MNLLKKNKKEVLPEQVLPPLDKPVEQGETTNAIEVLQKENMPQPPAIKMTELSGPVEVVLKLNIVDADLLRDVVNMASDIVTRYGVGSLVVFKVTEREVKK